jgi:hypothetical protein
MTSAPRNARLAIGSTALVGLAALVAACGSSATSAAASSATSSAASSAAASAPASAVSATPATTATPASGATTSTSAAGGGTARCATSSLALRRGVSQGAAGSTFIELDFTNVSHVTCTLYGYPGVSFTGGADHATQIGVAANENGATARQLVTLAPGAVAGAELRIVDARNYPIASCDTVTAHYLRVFPPNQLAPRYLALTTPTCSNNTQILTVSAVRAGAADAS